MTKESTFVALKSFRFGTEVLQPGDTVPVEDGRDYRLMLRLGQIAPAGSVTQTAGAQQEPDPQELSTFEQGEDVLVVYDDGTYDRAEFVSFAEADDAAQEALKLSPGDLIASVTVNDEPLTVPLGSVLPMHPVGKLLELFETRTRNGDSREREAAQALTAAQDEVVRLKAEVEKLEEAATSPDADHAAALKGRVDFLELLLQAIKAEGDPIADDFPVVVKLRANHITTLPGLKLLAEGEHGKANLVALDDIGDKSAEKILAALTPAGE